VPLAIIVCSFLAFFFKVSISEKEHAKIVKEPEEKLASA
jgi:lactose permease